MHNADTQCRVQEGAQKVEKNFLLKLLCLAIKYKFYFTVSPVTVRRRTSIKRAKSDQQDRNQ